MQQFLIWINGKKTYLTAIGMLVYAVLGWALNFLTPQAAMDIIWAALSLVGIRSAIAKVG